MPIKVSRTASMKPVLPPVAEESARRLNVVMVDEELPYPATSGKRLRTVNLHLRLARRHRITYICHRNRDPNEALRARSFFMDHGIRTVVVNRAVPAQSGLGFYTRLAGNLLSPLPYSVTSHNSRLLRHALRQHAAQNAVDLWHCEWTPYAAALRVVPRGRRVVMAHNIESHLWPRYAAN